jgi:hypothetical protein
MDRKTIYWVKTQLTNDENSSDEEMRSYFIEGGLTEAEADEWIARRSFYRQNIIIEDDDHNDIGVYDPYARSIQPLTEPHRSHPGV